MHPCRPVSLPKLSKGCFRLTCMGMRERINFIVVVACVALLPLLEFVDLVGRAIFPESLSPPTHVGRVLGESLSLPSRQVRDWNSHWGEPVASPSQNFLASLYGGTDDDVLCYFQCWRLTIIPSP